MNKLKDFINSYQQKLVLAIGYLLVAGIAFGLGHFSTGLAKAPEIRVEEAFNLPLNYTPNISGTQTESATTSNTPSTINCQGKIKGSSSHIYHMPGGAFYDKTTRPIRCFDAEADAKAAGFRKSSR